MNDGGGRGGFGEFMERGLEAAAAEGGGEGAEEGRAGDGCQGGPAEGVEAVDDVGEGRLRRAGQPRPRAQVGLLAHVEHRRHPRQPPRDLGLVLPDGAGRVGGEEEDGREDAHITMLRLFPWQANLGVARRTMSKDGSIDHAERRRTAGPVIAKTSASR